MCNFAKSHRQDFMIISSSVSGDLPTAILEGPPGPPGEKGEYCTVLYCTLLYCTGGELIVRTRGIAVTIVTVLYKGIICCYKLN